MGKPKKNAKIASRSKGADAAVNSKDRFVVVRRDDARIAKYPHKAGGEGFPLEVAQLKAIQVHPDQPVYNLISVAQYEFIQNHPEPIDAQRAVNLYAKEAPAETEE